MTNVIYPDTCREEKILENPLPKQTEQREPVESQLKKYRDCFASTSLTLQVTVSTVQFVVISASKRESYHS